MRAVLFGFFEFLSVHRARLALELDAPEAEESN